MAGGASGDYSVLYADAAPTTPIRLGQLFVDGSTAVAIDKLKLCTSLSPLTYTSLSLGTIASILASNNTWTGTNTYTVAGASPSPVQVTANDNSALSLLVDNDSNGTANLARVAISSGDANMSVFVSGSGRTSAPVTGGPTGAQGGIRMLGAHPLIFGTNNTYRGEFSAAGQFLVVPLTDATLPDFSFTSDPDTGMFRGGANQLQFTAGGEPIAQISTSANGLRLFARIAADSQRVSFFTQDQATERGYWGYPTASSDTMIMRNVVGAIIQFRASGNATSIEVGIAYAELAQQIRETNTISPAQIVANTDNYNPTGLGTAAVLRVSTDASRNLTGIAQTTAGVRLLLCNIGAQNLVLVHDATSTAANRFLCPGSANYTLNANDSVYLWYDTGSSRWRVIAAA